MDAGRQGARSRTWKGARPLHVAQGAVVVRHGRARSIHVLLAALASVFVSALLAPGAGAAVTEERQGAGQSPFVVPSWVTSIEVTAQGAVGGQGRGSNGVWVRGGEPGTAVGTIAVTPGTTLFATVGSPGDTCPAASGSSYNGGGGVAACQAFPTTGNQPGTGGGASDVRTVAGDLTSRLIVGAGGGGSTGGNKGGDHGMAPEPLRGCTSAQPGTQTAGGAPATRGSAPDFDYDCEIRPVKVAPQAGSFGQGGAGGSWTSTYDADGNLGSETGGGGGGGWYGGGGGWGLTAGAGGSNYHAPSVTNRSISTGGGGGRVSFTFDGWRLRVRTTGLGESGGYVTSSPASAVVGTIDCGLRVTPARGACSVPVAPEGMVTLTAHPDAYSKFVGFTGGGCSGSGLTCTVAQTQSYEVVADFARKKETNTVSVTLAGTGSGKVTGTDGFDCGDGGTVCSVELLPSLGFTEPLIATPAANSDFAGWTDCDWLLTGNRCEMSVSGNRSHGVTATFTLKQRTLRVARSGSGRVTGPGIDCGDEPSQTDCSETVADGTKVELTATPGAGREFGNFVGGGCTTSPCTVTVGADTLVWATFPVKSHKLSVLPIGAGAATITANGIDCGPPSYTDCNERYPEGTEVELTVTPAANSQLAGLVGGGCTTSPCTVTMTAETSVFAFVELKQRTLALTTAGTGSGTVSSSPEGIDCARGVAGRADCSKAYADGTSVTLTADPGAGSTFLGFSGSGCSGRALTCTVAMTAARDVTATFGRTRTLTVVPTGTGTGTVTGSGIDCARESRLVCSVSVGEGTEVVLTATPGGATDFGGFSGGDCTTSPCTVTVTADTTVSAAFTARPQVDPVEPVPPVVDASPPVTSTPDPGGTPVPTLGKASTSAAPPTGSAPGSASPATAKRRPVLRLLANRVGRTLRVTGLLELPVGTPASGCRGRVALTVRAGARTVASVTGRLSRSGRPRACRFSVRKVLRKIPGKLTVQGTYLGSTGLARASAPRKTVRVVRR